MTEKQRQENKIVELKREFTKKERLQWFRVPTERLYSCNAYTYRVNNLIFLQSYRTIIACIDLNTETCYDWLRLVYGYTATSAQHISKFIKKYGVVRKKTWKA